MAGSGRKVFAAGDVLTATDVQNYLQDQAVMVFASSAARGSAIASPTEGMVSYLSDTNNVEAYTGSAWTTVGLSGLVPVAPTSIANSGGSASTSGYTTTFTGVSSISLNGVFSADYDNYAMWLKLVGSTVTTLHLRVRAASTDLSTSSYYNTRTSGVGTNAASMTLALAIASANKTTSVVSISGPFLTEETGALIQTDQTSGYDCYFGSSGVRNGNSYDGFTIFPGAGTVTGTVSVYGYRK